MPGVAPPIKALCVVPMGMEEGTEADVPGPEFGLIVGEPAEFRFLGSTVRRDDLAGTVLDRWAPEELQELQPIVAHLDPTEGQHAKARPSRSPSTPTSTRSAPSTSGADRLAARAAGSSNTTSASPARANLNRSDPTLEHLPPSMNLETFACRPVPMFCP